MGSLNHASHASEQSGGGHKLGTESFILEKLIKFRLNIKEKTRGPSLLDEGSENEFGSFLP